MKDDHVHARLLIFIITTKNNSIFIYLSYMDVSENPSRNLFSFVYSTPNLRSMLSVGDEITPIYI